MKLIFAFACLFPVIALAGSAKVFVKLTPAGDFVASTTKVRGFVEKIDGVLVARDLTFAVSTLVSGQETRDDHMWKELGGKNAKIAVKDAKGSNGKGMGTLIVKGISAPIVFNYAEKDGNVIATFPIKFSNYKIKASFLGVGVDDDGKIEATIAVR